MRSASSPWARRQSARLASSASAPFSVSHTARRRASLSPAAISIRPEPSSTCRLRDSVDWSSPVRWARAPSVSSWAEAICAIRPNWARFRPELCIRRLRKLVMRRAASLAFHPAHASTAARTSATRVLWIGCVGVGINVCICIICICMQRRKAMLTTAPRVYGVTDPAEAMLMSGREFLEAVMDGRLPAPPMAKTLSFWLIEVSDGFAVFEGDAGEHLLNPLGAVHGGWALTLIDSATGCAGQTVLPAGVSYTSIETKANFSRPITKDTGRVRAEGRVVGRGRRIISCEGRIVDAGGRLLAHGTSTLMVLAGEKPTIAS